MTKNRARSFANSRPHNGSGGGVAPAWPQERTWFSVRPAARLSQRCFSSAAADSTVATAAVLSGDVVENVFQFLKVHGFDQMKIESGFFGAPDIVFSTEACEGNCLDVTFRTGLRGHFVTATVGQPDIAQQHVDIVQAHNLRRGAHSIGGYHVVTEMSEQA